MTPPVVFQLSLGSRVTAGLVAFILLFLGGLGLWAGLSAGLPHDWATVVVDTVSLVLIAGGVPFARVAWTGKASELMTDIVHDVGRIHWHV